MSKPWYNDEVHDLVDFSEKIYETMIPCAAEILRLNRFILDMMMFYSKRNKAKLIIQKKRSFLFRVFNFQSRPSEIDVPEDVVWEVVGQAKQILYNRCDYLAELCGYNRKED